mmetsp:Transcript_19158/g.37228  ORF Transcript_19158/g.37228 Transcript_19158/m.37228 type:complete len:340 (+) Transcript_19158:54-1073(+)
MSRCSDDSNASGHTYTFINEGAVPSTPPEYEGCIEVEVEFVQGNDNENMGDCLFRAVVVSGTPFASKITSQLDSKKVEVRFLGMTFDTSPEEPLQEEHSLENIRPVPPPAPSNFLDALKEGDLVDVYGSDFEKWSCARFVRHNIDGTFRVRCSYNEIKAEVLGDDKDLDVRTYFGGQIRPHWDCIQVQGGVKWTAPLVRPHLFVPFSQIQLTQHFDWPSKRARIWQQSLLKRGRSAPVRLEQQHAAARIEESSDSPHEAACSMDEAACSMEQRERETRQKLQSYNLLKYCDAFIEQGYDDPDFWFKLDTTQLDSLAQKVGMHTNDMAKFKNKLRREAKR